MRVMYFIVLAGILGILFIVFSWWIGERKKVIDQFESDLRIFIVFILIISFYLLLFSIFMLNIVIGLNNGQYTYCVTGLYFLIPLILGILLYALLPYMCERGLHLKVIPEQKIVKEIAHLLGLTTLPTVKISPPDIPPVTYGRGGTPVLSLPENLESFLHEDEQRAVIAHELSHIKQGDIGIFTWLTLLINGFTYWIILFPVAVYLRVAQYIMYPHGNSMILFLIPLLFFSLVLLKNSLSRTRESIADAYVVFYGFELPLQTAIIKYASKTTMKLTVFNFCFHGNAHPRLKVLNPLLATHPSTKERLRNIKEKVFLAEDVTNLSPQLAVWAGIASAVLFYTVFYSSINFSTIFDISTDTLIDIMWPVLFFASGSIVAVSYIFPTTKGSVLFSDLGNSTFLAPFLRNVTLTLVTAAGTYYILSLNVTMVRVFVSTVLGGFLLWIMGFAASRPTDFSKGSSYLVVGPLVWIGMVWVPVGAINSVFYDSIGTTHFVGSLFGTLLLVMLLYLIFMELGRIRVDREEMIIQLWNTLKEVPWMHDAAFKLLGMTIPFLVPVAASLGIFSVSCFLGTVVYPLGFWISLYGIIVVLLVYGLKKSDILFFLEMSYLVDILSGKINIGVNLFIQSMIKEYQSKDKGFDYAGLGLSNQRDTFYCVKTAHMISYIEPDEITEWVLTTEQSGGFALIPYGLPRLEATYYALNTLSIMGKLNTRENFAVHAEWVYTFFNGHYFCCENDTHSILLQTCYAVESLSLLGALKNVKKCAEWINTHITDTLEPKTAYFAVKSLKLLGENTEKGEKWILANDISQFRVDKNIVDVYYYVKILRLLHKEVPPIVLEQAHNQLETIAKKYRKRFL
jgi:Zn-dependent protease with chaperone function